MKNDELINAVAIIAEPVRIQILHLIAANGELRAKDILPSFDITQPTLSHHMSVLESASLISVRRDGRCAYYSINRSTFMEINAFFKGFVVAGVDVEGADVASVKKATVAKKTADKAPAVKKAPAKAAEVKKPVEKVDKADKVDKKKDKKDKDKKKDKKDKKKKK